MAGEGNPFEAQEPSDASAPPEASGNPFEAESWSFVEADEASTEEQEGALDSADLSISRPRSKNQQSYNRSRFAFCN